MDGGVLAGRLLAEEQSSKGKRSDETSAVDVSGQHYGCESNQSGTSSNVVISREKVLSKLESLILAQSERWRQA